MSTPTYCLGYPRIGENRELKKVLEAYWSQKCDYDDVQKMAKTLREHHLRSQAELGVKWISCNDFSLYDGMLDTIVMLGAEPRRFLDIADPVERYFAMARGDKNHTALAMIKWFNTNYHYLVPELSGDLAFRANTAKIEEEYREAKALGIAPKINLIGPLSFLLLSRSIENKETLDYFDAVLPVYEEILRRFAGLDDEIVVQMDEPVFAKDVDAKALSLLKIAYERLSKVSEKIKIIVATYFEHSVPATQVLVHTGVWGLALDFVHGPKNTESLGLIAQSSKMLIAGIIDGRNVWISDIKERSQFLGELARFVPKERMIPATSCSLLHLPYSLRAETAMLPEIKATLAFAQEKLRELVVVSKLFFEGEEGMAPQEQEELRVNQEKIALRRASKTIHDEAIKERTAALKDQSFLRSRSYHERIGLQHQTLGYDLLPTTTIGSFPQTAELRHIRGEYKKGLIGQEAYESFIKKQIDECIALQEEIGLDVLVHGEFERNDMVEYFAEFLEGMAVSQNGWVQSYGTRCVKPPIIYGDVKRKAPMTLKWSLYAQSKTKKIVKGMLTGPVTMLNWSFVRDDQPKAQTAYQMALAISDEIEDLQQAGIKIIQVDEAAFKEGYPLRKEQWAEYERWALESFLIATRKAWDTTQIHTHMCYSEFGDIIETIEKMDADVITIETARAGNRLLDAFVKVGYTKEIGPGVYDIHSPRVPSVLEMAKQIEALCTILPPKQLWINPDCGLKTRKYEEVRPALKNMVEAAKIVREKVSKEEV